MMDCSVAAETIMHAEPKLRILHVLRAPVGGLFRHVLDLAREQIARGHEVGLVTDSTTGGDHASDILARLKPSMALGIMRIPMSRQPSLSDIFAALRISRHANTLSADVIHGHGAKGGVYARVPGLWSSGHPVVRAYTPHGGSFSTTIPKKLQYFYMFAERLFEHLTDAYIFESTFVARRFADNIKTTDAVTRIVPNGISASEFSPVEPLPDAADLLFVGELRQQKGVALLIQAIVELTPILGKKLKIVLVGNGPDKDLFVAQVKALGLENQVAFAGARPAREAFKLGHILVLPSFSESLPYIILEAAGGQLPIVASNVGDIGNVLAPVRHRLVPPNDLNDLVAALHAMLVRAPEERRHEAAKIATFVADHYTVTNMVDAVFDVYREAIHRKTTKQNASHTSLALRS